MPRTSHSVTEEPKRSHKREPNGNRSLALAYIQSQCGGLFRRGFSLVAHREKLYVRTAGTKVPLYLDLSAPWQEVQRRAAELKDQLNGREFCPEEWRLRICGPARRGGAMSRDELEKFWRERKRAEGIKDETWRTGYAPAMARLDPRKPLSTPSLMNAISQTEPGSRNRYRVVSFYRQMTRAAGQEWNSALLDPLQMAGHRLEKRPTPLFADEEIEEIVIGAREAGFGHWWRPLALLAIYGLRPWEAWCAEPSEHHSGCVWIPVGKKNGHGCNPPREVPPFHPHWLELFDMKRAWKQELPVLGIRGGRPSPGGTLNSYLRRRGLQHGTSKTVYGFRNAYARRIHSPQYRVTDGDGAVFMGHTIMVHNVVYRRWVAGYDDPIARYLG